MEEKMNNGKGYNEYPDLLTGNTRRIDYTSHKEIWVGDYSCEALHVWHFNPKSKSFSDLPVAPNLKYLEINFSNCTNLVGLEKYPKLQRLDLNLNFVTSYFCILGKLFNFSTTQFSHL